MKQTFVIGIGGAAGQGVVATPGDIFAKIFSRRGLRLTVLFPQKRELRWPVTSFRTISGSQITQKPITRKCMLPLIRITSSLCRIPCGPAGAHQPRKKYSTTSGSTCIKPKAECYHGIHQ